MPGILERIDAARGVAKRSSFDDYVGWLQQAGYFNFGGQSYGQGLIQTLAGNRVEEVSHTLPGYAAALRMCPPAFAAQMVRALVLSQARFTFRSLRSANGTTRLFGNPDLGILERPWPNGTTGDLLARMEWHAGLAGNAYVYRQPDRLRVLRPDWVTAVYGSEQEPEDAAHALDGELLGYAYTNGGYSPGMRGRTQFLLPEEITHWSPIPDPEAAGLGMSWVTPAVRDIQGDRLATDHKLKFFENGATPNLVVKGIPATSKDQFDEVVEMMEARHAGIANAYRTLYLAAGADATVVGADLRQIDFKATQGAGETRISVLSRVPAPLLGISEGLAGSSLNAGNFGMARRMFADTWVYPSLQDVSAALASIVKVPADAELWFDVSDMPILREDAKDAAEIIQIQAATIRQLVDGGFDPDTVVPAVTGQQLAQLKHTGLLSVQLQPPGLPAPASPAPPVPEPAAPSQPAE